MTRPRPTTLLSAAPRSSSRSPIAILRSTPPIFLVVLVVLQAAAATVWFGRRLPRPPSSAEGDIGGQELATLRDDVEAIRSEVGRLASRVNQWENNAKSDEGSEKTSRDEEKMAGGVGAAAATAAAEAPRRNAAHLGGSSPRPGAVPPREDHRAASANATDDGHGPPVPFHIAATPPPPSWLRQYAHPHEITIHGVTLTYVVRRPDHAGFIRDHVLRESNGYALLKDAVARAKERRPDEVPLVLDVGSNHGLYALFAAKLGATVIALEPQGPLCRVIAEAARLNGEDVNSRIILYQNAALDATETVRMQRTMEGEGGVATVARAGQAGFGEDVVARPVADFIPSSEKRDICFMKVDVEGFELRAIPSAGNDLLGRTQNVLVEFGPPSRWRSAAKNSAADGEELLRVMADERGLEPRLIKSQAWDKFLQSSSRRGDARASVQWQRQQFALLDSRTRRTEFVGAMEKCDCEGYIWFTRDNEAGFKTGSAPQNETGQKLSNWVKPQGWNFT